MLFLKFFFYSRKPYSRKAHFVGSGERVKPGLSQAIIRGARPDSNSRPAIFLKISLIEEPCKSSHLAALDIANKKAGCLLCYDPNLRLPLWPSEEAAERNREHMEWSWHYKRACLNNLRFRYEISSFISWKWII